MLLHDKLLNAKEWAVSVPALYRGSKEDFEQFRRIAISDLKQAPVFEVSNVADYFYAGQDKEDWKLDKDFPRPMPPFPKTWLEWKIPQKVLIKGELQHLEVRDTFKRIGCLVTTPDYMEDANRSEEHTSELQSLRHLV